MKVNAEEQQQVSVVFDVAAVQDNIVEMIIYTVTVSHELYQLKP